jgi:CubicO group peptidase (beta-lactamase class C family)
MHQFRHLLHLSLRIIFPLFIAHPVFSQINRVLVPAKPEAAGFSTARLARIDSSVSEWISKGQMNGCVAMVVRDGKIVYHRAFGYNDPGKKDPVRTDQIYRIASQTKAVTSVAVMMLYEEGKFLLDDPVSRYLPEFARPQVLSKFNEADSGFTTVPSRSEITIRQLLTHTSGIGYAQIGSKEERAIYAKAGVTAGIGMLPGHQLAADMKKLAALPLMHQPGERFTYGLSTDVLGYLVQVVSGMPLDEFFAKRIFEPLGMKDTYFYLPEAKQKRLAGLFVNWEGKLTLAAQDGPSDFHFYYPLSKGTYLSGGAGLSSTALDYAIFLQMLLNGGEYNGKRLLSRNSVRMMTMNQIGELNRGANKFGLGFEITTEKGSSLNPSPQGVFEWGGAFGTTYWADPKERLIGIIYRQLWGTGDGASPAKFRVLVYSAIND